MSATISKISDLTATHTLIVFDADGRNGACPSMTLSPTSRNLNGFWQTTAHGLTMEWLVSRSTPFNAANPYRISGYVNGECRMSHAITATTARSTKRCEERVINRLAEISKELRQS